MRVNMPRRSKVHVRGRNPGGISVARAVLLECILSLRQSEASARFITTLSFGSTCPIFICSFIQSGLTTPYSLVYIIIMLYLLPVCRPNPGQCALFSCKASDLGLSHQKPCIRLESNPPTLQHSSHLSLPDESTEVCLRKRNDSFRLPKAPQALNQPQCQSDQTRPAARSLCSRSAGKLG